MAATDHRLKFNNENVTCGNRRIISLRVKGMAGSLTVSLKSSRNLWMQTVIKCNKIMDTYQVEKYLGKTDYWSEIS